MKNIFLRNPIRALTGIALLLIVPFMAMPVYGQSGPGSIAPPAPEGNIRNVSDVFVLINDIFNILFWLLIVLAAIFVLVAAFRYLTAGGDPEKVKKANHTLIYAAVAVVVAALAKAVPAVVCNFVATGGCEISSSGVPQN